MLFCTLIVNTHLLSKIFVVFLSQRVCEEDATYFESGNFHFWETFSFSCWNDREGGNVDMSQSGEWVAVTSNLSLYYHPPDPHTHYYNISVVANFSFIQHKSKENFRWKRNKELVNRWFLFHKSSLQRSWFS